MKHIFILIFTTFSITNIIFCQELISTSGDTFEADNINVSWSLGEVVCETFTEGDLILTNGFHQPIIIISKISKSENSTVKVYPNPTNNYIFIQQEESNFCRYQVFDINGRILDVGDCKEAQSIINISDYPKATYLLVLYNNNQKEIYKISKN